MSDTTPLDAVAYKVLADVLGGNGRVIAYRPDFAHVFGGACNALLLSQFWYWTNTPTVKRRGAGWFWESQKEITQETGLTRSETDTARRKLCQMGVLSEELHGVPATVHYRVNKDVLFEMYWAYILANSDKFAENLQTANAAEPQFAENLQTGLPKTRKQDRGKPANKIAQKVQTIPETYSENTQKIHQRVAPTGAQSFATLLGDGKENKEGIAATPPRGSFLERAEEGNRARRAAKAGYEGVEISEDQQAVNKAGFAKFKAAFEKATKGEQP